MSRYIFLSRLNSFVISNKNIFNIGKCNDYKKEISKNNRFIELYVIYEVPNNVDFFKIIKNDFVKKFTNEIKYGKEYFSGNPFEMIQEIENILYKNENIYKLDLFDLFINKKIDYTLIYNSPEYNKGIYHYIQDYCKDMVLIFNSYQEYEDIYYKNFLRETIENDDVDLSNSIYICSYCCNYKVHTKNKRLMIKHLHRKNKCKSYSNKYSFEEAYNDSLSKVYYMLFDNKDLTKDEYSFIVYNYILLNNYIEDDFKKDENIYLNNITDETPINYLKYYNIDSYSNIIKDDDNIPYFKKNI